MKIQSGRASALCILALVLIAAPVHGGEPRVHDGFFLRLSAGGGYGATELTNIPPTSGLPGDNLKLSGGTGDVNFAIGGAVKPNLILHGTIWGWLVSSPDVESGGQTGTAGNANVDMSAYGVGVTYYLMPSNFYLSSSVGIAELSIEEGGVTYTTDSGFALDATIGKEWWVGDGWGLGAAAGFSWHSVGDSEFSETWSGPGFGVRFSATMN